MDPDKEENNILDLEEGTADTEQDGVQVVSTGGPTDAAGNPLSGYSIRDLITYFLANTQYQFDVATMESRTSMPDITKQTFNVEQLFQTDATQKIFSDNTKSQFNDIVTNQNLAGIPEFLKNVDAEIKGASGVTDKTREEIQGGSGYISYTLSPKSKKEEQITDIVEIYNDVINDPGFGQTREKEAEARGDLGIGDYVGDIYGTYRSSHPAWGYKTDQDGMVQSTVDFDATTGEAELLDAPFLKGAEYRNFVDMDPSEIFILQQRMVRAGMDAPPVAEFGQWSEREAKFMAKVFIRATDTGQWELDKNAGIPMWETTLTELEDIYTETQNFADMYNDMMNLEQQAKANPTQVKELMDQVGVLLGINFTDADYVEFAEEVNKGLAQAAASQKEYEESLITDRDVILGTTLGQYNTQTVEEGKFPRYLPGSQLPLIIPGYDTLRGEKGDIPEPLNAMDVIKENLLARPEIQGEIASTESLQQIQYATNLFEASMAQIELGDA
jgi:hypothetical protein